MPDPNPPAPPAEPPAPPAPPAQPPAPAPGSADPRVGDLNFKVPDQYAKEPWAQNIKDPQTLWKEFANAQSLIGKKGVIPPGPNATPDEIKAFRVAQGMPELPEGYEFKTIEPLKDQQRNAEIDNKMKNILHKHGVPKTVGEAVIQEMETMIYETSKPKLLKAAEQEKGWKELKKQTFGESSDIVSEHFKSVLAESLGDGNKHLAAKLNTMDNDGLATLMVFAKKIHDTYVGESKLPPGGGAPPAGDLQTTFQNLSTQKLQIKADPNMAKHVKDQKIAEINRKMMELGNKANEQGINLFAIK